ncbi:MAG: polyphosphate kinase 1 [Bdellovibrionales bacterium]|nr:polyphosphate kinase 1 [Bdellovibrionales bacterium]
MKTVGFLPTLPSLLDSPRVPLIHRDVSWLQFNDRVLAESRQASNPLLERAKFLAISGSNLDEFFMIRFSSLARSITAASRNQPAQVNRLTKIKGSILETVSKFGAKQLESLDLLTGELEGVGIHVVRNCQEGDAEFAIGKQIFVESILPQIPPPQALTRVQIQSTMNLQTLVVFPGDLCFRLPRNLAPMVAKVDPSQKKCYFFFLDDLIAAHLGPAFRLEGQPGFLRLTRDGDFTAAIEFEDTDSVAMAEKIRTGLGNRELGRPVRLQYRGNVEEPLLERAVSILRIPAAQVIPAFGSLYLHGLWAVMNHVPDEIRNKPGVQHPPVKGVIPAPFLDPKRFFEKLKTKDFFVHQPYDSFDSYVQWIEAAGKDPDVLSIEQTVYRVDHQSPVIAALKTAAENGKKVRVVIELRARFDELNNLKLTDELKQAGIEVGFGFGKLKLHAKIALVTRKDASDPSGIRAYTHLSTGNYNRSTAKQYTDFSIFTGNTEVGQDARHFFDAVFKKEVPKNFKHLVHAPSKMHRRLLQLIQAETEAAKKGEKARIVAKVNALVDEAVIESLYEASKAGVQVDLIVRGACSLIPGVPGLSQNIRVISIVDRYLEHSRLYSFESSKAIYLSSADWMPRNFFSRLELAFPILDPQIFSYVRDYLIPTYLSDTVKAKELTPMGTWKKRAAKSNSVRSQLRFQEISQSNYRGTPLENH